MTKSKDSSKDSELKTLKEMPEALSTVEHPFKEWETWRFIEGVLKQEAIKEIKDLDNDGFLSKFCQDNPTQALRDYIKWKNNLTEEDLK